jgi:CDP-diacylglycerol--glycerol-3-phosphate 3-phosphatidyltransferase
MSAMPSSDESTPTAIKAFGPTALATPANAVTLARLVAAPLFAILVTRIGPWSWFLFISWTVLALSDGVDGRIARWHGTTRSGAFLDPLADKFLVVGALCALAALDRVAVVALVLIAARELSMSLYRVVAARDGVSIPARGSAKIKTLFQDLAIGGFFLPPIGQHHAEVAEALLWVAVALTMLSGYQYLRDGRRLTAAARTANPIVSSGS